MQCGGSLAQPWHTRVTARWFEQAVRPRIAWTLLFISQIVCIKRSNQGGLPGLRCSLCTDSQLRLFIHGWGFPRATGKCPRSPSSLHRQGRGAQGCGSRPRGAGAWGRQGRGTELPLPSPLPALPPGSTAPPHRPLTLPPLLPYTVMCPAPRTATGSGASRGRGSSWLRTTGSGSSCSSSSSSSSS